MRALMQDYPLTLDRIFDHAAKWSAGVEVVSRNNDGTVVRSTYAELHARAKQVSNALLASGIKFGDRVATMAWNGSRHFEVCYGTLGIGAIHHTLNPRLFPEQIAYIVNHAQDRLILADAACAGLLEQVLPQCPCVEGVVFLTDWAGMPRTAFPAQDYESWIAEQGSDCAWGDFPEETAAGLCYTSGTTGNPKGVLYGHRSNYLHAMMTLQPDALNLSRRDTVLLVVPMYHANAWGVVYSAPLVGAKLVLPGQRMDGASIHELIESEGVTYSAAVPTVWQMLLDHLRATGGGFSTLKRVTVGGSACPESLIRTFNDDYGVDVIQGWGMTETSPLATVAVPGPDLSGRPFDEQVPFKLRQGRLLGNIDLKVVDDAGAELPRDGRTPGRLMIKGPTIASGYFGMDGDALDAEGFFDTGDVATLTGDGVMQITDRAKDVIKSGGEWISSIDVENIAVGHPKAQLCAVIGVTHPKWDERPALFVQLKPGESATAQEFLDFLDGRIAKWWMPDHVVFVDEIPLGPTGKIDKKAMRDRLVDYELPPAAVVLER
ncbi:MAG: long-chain-fatty-acid--CoA ligase [Sphingomonadales bacterium]|nr:long-chain-fatty-acid--CoA ligase [Sphingomonadales bacterium]MDE2569707.1 long-chain-fatty-acid--CoA ligase [Sphingomonadales bacterium]